MKKTLKVVGAIIVQNGKILAVKRGANKNAAVAFKYEFVGGKIEEGETPQAALKREVFEEMDYDVEVGEKFMQVVYEYEDVFVDLQTYFCKPLSESFVLKEHLDYKWLSQDELFSVEWAPADTDIIERLSKL
ncbi:MAG: (deoxy)nucleoside triphosphate pyrophosphohydrolase [Clostridia bacterium]|nr:(deoxy)nucleoside triphosphate pyrophosphohydrolase [Clostridia bacterium]MDE7328524.1 (deoxy)nucleoside triphosphate pyrophosphohydrolase [Clostridia bacterium]